MKCDEVQNLNGPYLDSELDAKTTLKIQQHLAVCPACARVFAAEAKLDARMMAGLKQGRRTAALWEQFEQQVATAAPAVKPACPSPLAPRQAWLSALNHQLSTLLWPHPKAWAGLAAVWVVILAANFAARDPLPVREAMNATPPSPQLREMLKQQEQLLAELVGPIERSEGIRPKPVAPQPRSQRREQFMNA